ncbi:unnamed protein product [Rotaria socialis]|uniref:Uncharacterized protein n=1 Tax=Rotaria socialis TaxID=392032 RepID=A0A817WNQ1_9BILA|nr:unnamed protein product [Rotaria socialis]
MIRLGRIRRDPTISEHGPSSSSVEPQRDPSLFLVELERGLSSSSSFPIEPQNGSSSSITISLSSSTTLSDKPDYEIISEGVKKQTLPSARTKHRTQYLHEWEKKPELTLDRFSSDLATQYPFINYIIARALIIINHDQFQHHVLNELCAEIVKSRTRDCNELQQFVQEECTQLKLQVCVDKLNVDNVLMQCETFNYNESQPCQIFISQLWYKYILAIEPHIEEYKFHVVLGVIKLIHEVCHCCTRIFCAFASQINTDNKPIKVTPPNIGRKIVMTSPTRKALASKRKRGVFKTRTVNKSTKEIDDMGYGGEQLLLGTLSTLIDLNDFLLQIIRLRLDIHEKSSIASSKYTVDLNFIDTLFDIDKLKVIDDLSQLKIKLDSTLEPDQQTKTICHAVPVRSTRQKLRRADSDSSLC